MEVKEAVQSAKSFVFDLLKDEGAVNLGLEEIEYLEDQDIWEVTIGFSRPWNTSRGALSAITGEDWRKRDYRVVKIRNSDGQVLGMKVRQVAA
jgi:hypothetical protein